MRAPRERRRARQAPQAKLALACYLLQIAAMKLRRLLAFVVFATVSMAMADVHTLPTVNVEASPLETFADQGGLWNYEKVETSTYSPSIQEDMNASPGIASRSEGSPATSIRGSAQSGRVLSLVDGVPLFSATGIGSQTLLVPQENLNSLEVYKTPSSVFYGASAMGGVLNYRTETLERPRVRVSGGSYDSPTHGLNQKSIFLGTPVIKNKNNHLQSSVFLSDDSGRFNYTINDAGTGRQTRDQNNNETHRAQLKGVHKLADLEIEENVIAVQNRRRSPGSVFAPSQSDTQTQAQLLALGVKSNKVPAGEMSFRSSALFEHVDSMDQMFASSSTAQSLQQTLRYELTEVDASPEFTVNWRHDQLKASYADNSRFNDDQVDLGMRLLFPAGPNWMVQTGARYLTNFGQFITAFGAFWEVRESKFWMNYSEGLRAPTLTDQYARYSNYTGNPDLKPELSQGLEVGYKRRLWGPTLYDRQGLFFSAVGYRTYYRKLIEYSSTGTQIRPVNRGEAWVKGVELQLGYQGPVWKVEASTDATESNDELSLQPLRLTPRQKHVLRGTYQWGPIEPGIRYTYWGAYLDQKLTATAAPNEYTELGPWRTVDFSVQTVGFANWWLQAGVLNVFDEQRQLTFGFPEPGRIVYLSYQRDF